MIWVIVLFICFILFVCFCIISVNGYKSPEELELDDNEQWEQVCKYKKH